MSVEATRMEGWGDKRGPQGRPTSSGDPNNPGNSVAAW